MTFNDVKNAEICIKNGELCLAKEGKNGRYSVLRTFSKADVLNMAAALINDYYGATGESEISIQLESGNVLVIALR